MDQFAATILFRLMALLGLSLIFVPLEFVVRFIQAKPFPKCAGVPADILHWILTPLFVAPLVTAILTSAVAAVYLTQGKVFTHLEDGGFGPIILQPLWLIILEMLLFADLCAYCRHRIMHKFIWPVHSVHHSSTEVYWLSAVRFHPLDVLAQSLSYLIPAYLLGFPLKAIAIYMPFVTLYNFLLHSPIDWSFGPLRYFVVTPAYHRWHHVLEEAGQQANFATIFSFYDILFGTFYFPRHKRPENFGVLGAEIPRDYFGQIFYPLVRAPGAKVELAEGGEAGT